ncbi:MAG TPA: hypothetical protein VJ798_02035 [Rhizomicrobium sp.]|nr:hypothetical protein [Rhizomicrobium sp.]
MILPKPMPAYDFRNEAELRAALEREDRNNQKLTRDVVIEGRRLVLVSPDGTRFALTVSNAGVLAAVAL